jgi:hypothetical protein
MTHLTRWPLWSVTVCAALAATLWWWPSSDEAVVPEPPPEAAQAPTPVIAPAQIASTTKSADVALLASAFKLVGTVMAANNADSFALLRRTADAQVVQLRTGDRIEGLTVGAIKPDAIVLTGLGRSVVIETDRKVAPPMPPRSLPPPPDVEPAWAGDPEPFGH